MAGGQATRPSGGVAMPRESRLAFHGARIGVAFALAILTYILFPAAPAVDLPVYEVGSVASDNVIAPFAFRVLKTTPELKAEQTAIVRNIEPVYNFVPAALDTARQALASFSAAIADAATSTTAPPVAAVQRAASTWGMQLTVPQATYLATERRRSALVLSLSRVFDRWLSSGVASAGALDSVHGPILLRARGEERRVNADSVLTFSMLVSRARLLHPDPGSSIGDPLYIRLLATFFHPTIVPDRATTEMRREEARRSVSTAKYDVLAGEKIVGANEVVGREQNEKLRALHDAVDKNYGGRDAGRRIIGAILFDFLLIALLGLTIIVCRPQVYENFRWLLTVALSATFVLAGGAIVSMLRPVHPELVPVALAAVILSALFEQRISIIAAMVWRRSSPDRVCSGERTRCSSIWSVARSPPRRSARFDDGISRTGGL